MSALVDFVHSLNRPDIRRWIRNGLIGENLSIDGPFGTKQMIYADYVASGRALMQTEDFIRDRVLPYYANSHTRASYCGSYITELREAARGEIARITRADDDTSVIFTGSGSTAGINRIVGLLDLERMVQDRRRVVVLIGPYEHHSNLLPWRESGAEIVEITEDESGGPSLMALRSALDQARSADLIVGSFSAASNVTGIVSDVDEITRILKQAGAIAIWDYGCAAPYLPMDMKPGTDAAKDAIVYSSHKFPGGPGASGVTVIRQAIVRRERPTLPGGGTVSFVSPWDHIYSTNLAEREEGGTPNVVGDIRAALVLLVKEALGQEWQLSRQQALRERALNIWSKNPHIELLGNLQPEHALPIFSFRVRDTSGDLVHHQLFTRLLSDVHGIQARGGCACAGSYAHRLLGLDESASQAMITALNLGLETEKPGWVRLNFSALMSDEKVDTIITAVNNLAANTEQYRSHYQVDTKTARYRANKEPVESLAC